MSLGFGDHLETFSLPSLDKLLVRERGAALRVWPYTNTNDIVRCIEAEYRRRRVALPEDRDVLGREELTYGPGWPD